MRLTLFVAFFTLSLGLTISATSCGDDDGGSCDGEILNTCTDCTCPTGKKTTCTAYPEGDTTSRERCCRCE